MNSSLVNPNLDLDLYLRPKAFGVQTLSGTGALKVGFDFLARIGYKTIYISNPTWGKPEPETN